MNSFYGGKPGASLIVVKHFNTYDEMVSKFQEGDAYTEVQYDQYVIIGKEDSNKQGNIYRRGYLKPENFKDGGAEFVLNITGPAGSMSELNFVSYNTISNTEEIKYDENNPFAETLYIGAFTIDKEDLVPGNENSVINWKVRNTKSKQGQVKSDIALQIPYPVVDLTVQSLTQEQIQNGAKMGLVVDKNEPFYQKWTLAIPEGVVIPETSMFYTLDTELENSKDNLGIGGLAFKERG